VVTRLNKEGGLGPLKPTADTENLGHNVNMEISLLTCSKTWIFALGKGGISFCLISAEEVFPCVRTNRPLSLLKIPCLCHSVFDLFLSGATKFATPFQTSWALAKVATFWLAMVSHSCVLLFTKTLVSRQSAPWPHLAHYEGCEQVLFACAYSRGGIPVWRSGNGHCYKCCFCQENKSYAGSKTLPASI